VETIDILTGSKQYPIYIGKGASAYLPDVLRTEVKNHSAIFIISDSNVAPLYLDTIKEMLPEERVHQWVVPAGEPSKSIREYEKILSFALSKKLDRKTVIIALGGGVVGDLAGFAAATLLRGVRFIQMPTTLLAHDSSVGGKVGINHPIGKNLIGAFYQPEAVLYDLDFLESMSVKEWRSGFAEIIKGALIRDDELFRFLTDRVQQLPIENEGTLLHAIFNAINIKAGIVQEDEHESGVRAHLNFGHTLGHAIEAESRFQNISHGEAVLIGMLFAFRLSEQLYQKRLMPENLIPWIKRLGYSISHPSLAKPELLLERMKQDKKNENKQIRMVVLKSIAKVETRTVTDERLLKELKDFHSWTKQCESS
jgi:3-dehydroquinate synthase